MNRIIYKILFTSFNFLISTSVLILVARSLGPENYGMLSYIFATYDFFITIFTLTLPNAYVFFLSEKKYDSDVLNALVFGYLGIVSIILLLITLLTFSNDLGKVYLWGQNSSPILVYFSLIVVSAMTIQSILLTFSDTTLQTVQSEISRLLSKLFLFISVVRPNSISQKLSNIGITQPLIPLSF